ncbi:hypothetical protein [Desulfonispora thiosulfatigenes]|nr:hypothetical protein [Desulfonispora thiosulfatigenes]
MYQDKKNLNLSIVQSTSILALNALKDVSIQLIGGMFLNDYRDERNYKV